MLQASQGRLGMEELRLKRGQGTPLSVRKKWAKMTYISYDPFWGICFIPAPHGPQSIVNLNERLLVVPGHSLS